MKDDTFELEPQHKHILKLVARDSGTDGWTKVSEALYSHLSENMPKQLFTFEKLANGGRAQLTNEGAQVLSAMAWL